MTRALKISVLLVGGMSASFGATFSNNGALNNLGGNAMSDLVQAEDFTLTTLSNLTSIRFFTLEATGAYAGSINWGIFNSVGNQPGVLLGGGVVAPTRNNLGTVVPLSLDAFENTFSVNVTNLVAATYWLVLHNGPLAATAFQDFYWGWTDLNAVNTATTRGLERSLAPPSAIWDDTGNEHAFAIFGDPVNNGVIPEPGTIMLISAGFAALWVGRKSRIRRIED